MPRVLGNEDCPALLKTVTDVVQYENSTAFHNKECFVHLEVSMDRNADTDHHLLGPQREILRTRRSAEFDEDISMVTKMNEMFAFVGAKHITLRSYASTLDDALRQHLAYTEASHTEEE
jgi:hypothetical protein